MNRNDKNNLQQETAAVHMGMRLIAGLCSIAHSIPKAISLGLYLLATILLWVYRTDIFNLTGTDFVTILTNIAFPFLFVACAVAGLLCLLLAFGTPWGSWSINRKLQRIGFRNRAGEAPRLLSKRSDRDNPNVQILEFITNGIPREEWECHLAKLETILNLNIVEIKDGRLKNRILVKAVPGHLLLPDFIPWKDELNWNNFVLVLGENLLKKVTVDLSRTPHLLLAGASGSGKSVLTMLLAYQCVRKHALVYLIDFKGGMDYGPKWHQHCTMIFDLDTLHQALADITSELERRMILLSEANCHNIDEYANSYPGELPRIVVVFDEISEAVDKTGADKATKEKIAQVERMLVKVARLGRAPGINLILSTQRPSADILAGDLRNNVGFRCCGRSDNNLSMIALDNTDAATRNEKDSQGRFLTGDGTLFQAYYFNEDDWDFD